MMRRFLVALGSVLLGCDLTSSTPSPAADSSRPLLAKVQQARFAAGESRKRRLKLATWNLEWLHRTDASGAVPRDAEDYERLRRYADALDADVVALQEVDGERAAARVFSPERYHIHVSAQNIPQRTGFAYKRHLKVTRYPDYAALDVGHLRNGADIAIELGSTRLRLLSVHLKGGCHEARLDRGKPCLKLQSQVPALERWIDERARAGELFAVLGDFNRRFFSRPDEPFWQEIDDANPPEADLFSPTSVANPTCWNGKFRHFIDHLVFGRSAAAQIDPGSFHEQHYLGSDAPFENVLSDHCPLSVTLEVPAGARIDGQAVPAVAADAITALPPAPERGSTEGPLSDVSAAEGPVKGNISDDGDRIYHVPGCPYHAATRIDPSRGERHFRTEAEALAAGWRKARNCP